jgi:hypothetical protein
MVDVTPGNERRYETFYVIVVRHTDELAVVKLIQRQSETCAYTARIPPEQRPHLSSPLSEGPHAANPRS